LIDRDIDGATGMKLDRVEVKGFKSIREIGIELRSLNVLVGANGAGKSNFIALFKMLTQMSQGNLQVFVAQSGGANSLLYFGQKVTENIQIGLRFGAIQQFSIRRSHSS
jgi:predicted ATPase